MRGSERHYGMDWLRIAAFALLILYHVGMVLAPWHWVVKSATTYPALIAPMAFVTPWRLALLFAVSGYASAKLLAKSGSTGAFLHARNLRLLVPLAFGMAVLVPIEMWVRVREAGYAGGYPQFWAVDYWRIGTFWGVEFPGWEHLWFVAYLWAYTIVLGGIVAFWGSGWGAPLLARLTPGLRLLWVPAGVLAGTKLALMFLIPERQGLFTDWTGHAEFLPMLLFGFVVANTPQAWPVLARVWRPAVTVALLCGAIVVWSEHQFPGETIPPHAIAALDRAARVVMAWSMTLALFHLANRWLNRDHRWRKPLAEAVFPAYLIHHPAIVLTAWWTVPLRLHPVLEFALLLAASVGASAALYLIGRRIGWLRPLIGLSRKPVTPAAAQFRPAL